MSDEHTIPWYGKRKYIGLHYDLHGNKDDSVLGTQADPEQLVPMLKTMAPDWVQTDCKGHPGYTSWFSQVPEASVPPRLVADALIQWRTACDQLQLPLHCHYSGLWDSAAGERHPQWAVRGPQGETLGKPFADPKPGTTNDIMCPRGDYVDKLMIPQLLELIDRYRIDGFWVDGEIWAAKPCYCATCMDAWRRDSGQADAPTDPADARWAQWMAFTRESFRDYVRRYCHAVHNHRPGVRVCSNWLQTFKDPGKPTVPTDWISGDNSWVFGLDQSRCEARFLSTRGKPWDIMLWAFYMSHGLGDPTSPPTFKPPQMLMQEAAVLTTFGGNVQIYEHPPVRDGRLVPWRQKRLRSVVKFIRSRRSLCQGSVSIPQVAVLHSEHHLHATIGGPNLLWNVNTKPVEGAVYALLENHFGVDILDEWALIPRIGEFVAVVVPEQHAMSTAMVAALAGYLRAGGRVLATGAAVFERLGEALVGARLERSVADRSYSIAVADGDVPVFSRQWAILAAGKARVVRTLGEGCFLDGCDTAIPGALVNSVGKGRLLYVPGDLFADFYHNRYPLTRALVGELMATLAGSHLIAVEAPVAVDVAFRRLGNRIIIHCVNRASGITNQPHNGAIDEIPPVGPIRVRLPVDSNPVKIEPAFEEARITAEYSADTGRVDLFLESVHIHAALVVTLRR